MLFTLCETAVRDVWPVQVNDHLNHMVIKPTMCSLVLNFNAIHLHWSPLLKSKLSRSKTLTVWLLTFWQGGFHWRSSSREPRVTRPSCASCSRTKAPRASSELHVQNTRPLHLFVSSSIFPSLSPSQPASLHSNSLPHAVSSKVHGQKPTSLSISLTHLPLFLTSPPMHLSVHFFALLTSVGKTKHPVSAWHSLCKKESLSIPLSPCISFNSVKTEHQVGAPHLNPAPSC